MGWFKECQSQGATSIREISCNKWLCAQFTHNKRKLQGDKMINCKCVRPRTSKQKAACLSCPWTRCQTLASYQLLTLLCICMSLTSDLPAVNKGSIKNPTHLRMYRYWLKNNSGGGLTWWQWALLTEALNTKINLNPRSEHTSLGGLHVKTHQEASVFLSERHKLRSFFHSSESRTVRAPSTPCILNVVA